MRVILLSAICLCFMRMQCQFPQSIPGKIECELYSNYEDSDTVNNGSGKLNPPDGTYLDRFRMYAGVDISYTKEKNIDNSIYNKVQPEMGSLYVGWTVPGEWIDYEFSVQRNDTYIVSAMYTAHDNGSIILEFDNNKELVGNIPSTYDAADTIAWRHGIIGIKLTWAR